MLSPVVIAGAFVAIACWALTIAKLADLARDPGNRPLRYLTGTLVLVSLTMTMQPLAHWLDHATGILDLGRVAGNVFAIAGAGFAQGVQLHLTQPEDAARRQVRPRMALTTATALVVVTLFLATPAPYDVTDPYVVSHAYYYATPTPANAPYQFVVVAYLGWACAESAWRMNRYARTPASPLLRVGLRLIALGCLLTLAYFVLKLATIVLAGTAPALVAYLQNRVLVLCFTTGALTMLVGATLPSWGAKLGLRRLWERLTAHRQCRRLRPLWTLIDSAIPQVVLLPHPTDPVLRRARMTVEILDGYIELSRWIPADADPAATQGGGVEATRDTSADGARGAAVEAELLAGAARRARSGVPPADHASNALSTTLGTATGADAQVSHLIRVADVLRRSPLAGSEATDSLPGRFR